MRLVIGVAALAAIVGLAASGCEDDNLVTGPTPAGVTTNVTVSIPGDTGSSSSTEPVNQTSVGTSTTTTTNPTGATAPSGDGGAGTLTEVEIQVRQADSGCWEVLAPAAPAGVSRQDLWFGSAASCQGPGWEVAARVYATAAAAHAAGASTAGAYQDGAVLVVVTAGAPAAVRSAVAAVAGLQPIGVAG